MSVCEFYCLLWFGWDFCLSRRRLCYVAPWDRPDDGGCMHMWNVCQFYQTTQRSTPEDSRLFYLIRAVNVNCNLKDQKVNSPWNFDCRYRCFTTVDSPWEITANLVCRVWELASEISFKFTPVTSICSLFKHAVPGWFARCGNSLSARLHNSKRGNARPRCKSTVYSRILRLMLVEYGACSLAMQSHALNTLLSFFHAFRAET
jgi:hypothetical protein